MSRSKLSNSDLKFYNTSAESDVIYAKIKGTSTNTLIFEGSTSATKVTIKNVADPLETGDVATFDFVNTKISELSNGINWKIPVRAKSTSNIAGTMSGKVLTCSDNGQKSLDGVIISVQDRVLLSEQTDQSQNGVYVCSTEGDVRSGFEAAAVFTRAADSDTAEKLRSCAVFVEEGTLNADTAFVQTTDNIVLGTSNLVFSQFSSVGEILAGVGLSKSGNTISANVDDATIEIEAGSLTVKDNSITASKIATNTITANEVEDATLTAAEMADNSCIERCIADSAVTTSKLNNSSVASTKLQDGACLADKLASNSVTTVKILDANVTTAKLADSAVDSDKLADSSVVSSKLASGAVLTASIGDAQVSTNKIIDANITATKLSSNSVVSSKIAANNVLTSHIAANQITTALIAANQIQASHLKSDSVTTDKLLNAAVTADKIAANSITTSKMGTLTGLTVNGIVNATSFVASGSGGESDNGFTYLKPNPCLLTLQPTKVLLEIASIILSVVIVV